MSGSDERKEEVADRAGGADGADGAGRLSGPSARRQLRQRLKKLLFKIYSLAPSGVTEHEKQNITRFMKGIEIETFVTEIGTETGLSHAAERNLVSLQVNKLKTLESASKIPE